LGQGVEAHKAFLKKLGQMDRLRTELPRARRRSCRTALERTQHHHPSPSVTYRRRAVAAVMGINAVMNGGYLIPPTFLKRTEEEAGRWRSG